MRIADFGAVLQICQMKDPSLFVRGLVAKMSGRKSVTPEMLLWHDLRLGGDDIFELFEEIHRSYGTSFSNFDFAVYFPNETQAMMAGWAARLGFNGKWKAVSVQHLVDVTARGAWFDPLKV